ncbi:MAG: glycosyltransferase family 4 protein [Myxococcales bacterium]|nr:glycosyltransferase family 4 protein [Myxococcales bacterium]
MALETAPIILVSPCSTPVRPAAAAGVEVVVHALARRLPGVTHVLARPGSELPAGVALIPVPRHERLAEALSEVVARRPAAILCDHSGCPFPQGDALPRFFRVFHVAPQYVYCPAPSPRVGFVSAFLRDAFSRHAGRSYASCPLLRNGVDAAALARPQERAADGDIVYIGRLNRLKGVDMAAEACARRGRALVVYGGHGATAPADIVFNDLAYLAELRARYPDVVRYEGPLDDVARKVAALSRAACLLIPSREPESCSLVALEGVALGIPVVAFAHGGLLEYVAPRLHLAPYRGRHDDDVHALGAALDQALRAPPRPAALPPELHARAMARRYQAWLTP